VYIYRYTGVNPLLAITAKYTYTIYTTIYRYGVGTRIVRKSLDRTKSGLIHFIYMCDVRYTTSLLNARPYKILPSSYNIYYRTWCTVIPVDSALYTSTTHYTIYIIYNDCCIYTYHTVGLSLIQYVYRIISLYVYIVCLFVRPIRRVIYIYIYRSDLAQNIIISYHIVYCSASKITSSCTRRSIAVLLLSRVFVCDARPNPIIRVTPLVADRCSRRQLSKNLTI
jgi:hypothetical protein